MQLEHLIRSLQRLTLTVPLTRSRFAGSKYVNRRRIAIAKSFLFMYAPAPGELEPIGRPQELS